MSYSKTIPLERPSHGESNELRAVRIRLWVLGIGPGQLSELTRELTSPPSSAGQLSCSADQLSAALRAIACIFFCRPPPMPRPLPLRRKPSSGSFRASMGPGGCGCGYNELRASRGCPAHRAAQQVSPAELTSSARWAGQLSAQLPCWARSAALLRSGFFS